MSYPYPPSELCVRCVAVLSSRASASDTKESSIVDREDDSCSSDSDSNVQATYTTVLLVLDEKQIGQASHRS